MATDVPCSPPTVSKLMSVIANFAHMWPAKRGYSARIFDGLKAGDSSLCDRKGGLQGIYIRSIRTVMADHMILCMHVHYTDTGGEAESTTKQA